MLQLWSCSLRTSEQQLNHSGNTGDAFMVSVRTVHRLSVCTVVVSIRRVLLAELSAQERCGSRYFSILVDVDGTTAS
jgi:hypothetical protein